MTWIQTYTGAAFDPLNPSVHDISFDDIAHSLSMQCRYNGHCKHFYSVAQHCVLLSREVRKVSKGAALTALLHDASEAFLCDMVRPLKEAMPEYVEYEKALDAAIAERFGLEYPWPPIVKDFDTRILFDERRVLLGECDKEWDLKAEPLGIEIDEFWDPRKAEILFKREFHYLKDMRA